LPEKDFRELQLRLASLFERRDNKSPQIGWDFIEIIFQVIKWIIYSIEKLGFRRRRIVQMISVE
jgi:hypothetical protein